MSKATSSAAEDRVITTTKDLKDKVITLTKELAAKDKPIPLPVDANKIKCSICPQLLDRSDVNDHMKVTHNLLMLYQCEQCPNTYFTTSKDKDDHTSTHISFKCKFCSKSFDSEIDRQSHLSVSHKCFGCRKCLKIFPTLEERDGHRKLCPNAGVGTIKETKDGLRYRCPGCPEHFANYGRRDRHYEKVHGLKERGYKCLKCNIIYKTPTEKAAHLRKEHPNEKSIYHFICKKCPKRFKSQHLKLKHIVESHGGKKFQCLACDKSYYDERHLARHHRRDHLMERMLSCSECEYKAFSKSYLDRHMSIHTGVKAHSCDVCSKSFSIRSTLTHHMYTHAGAKRVWCKICNKGFAARCSLSGHMVRYHPGDV